MHINPQFFTFYYLFPVFGFILWMMINYTGFAIIILVVSLLTLAINTYLTRRVCSRSIFTLIAMIKADVVVLATD